jgi:hypothetical protein
MKTIVSEIVGLSIAFVIVGCAALKGADTAPVDPAKVAAEVHTKSVEACKAYHAAVALGLKPSPAADSACKAAQGVCGE